VIPDTLLTYFSSIFATDGMIFVSDIVSALHFQNTHSLKANQNG